MKLSATAMIVAALLALPACDGGDKSTTSDDSTGEATDASATDASATDASATDATTGTPTTGDPTTETTGSPAELSFAADVWDPILSPTCSCHGAGSGGLTLGADAATAYAALVGVKSIGSPLNHVEAGDSTASYLINKLEGTQIEAGGSGGKMPLAGMVSADQIQTIKDWIDAGALP
jgi:hypothetical protein